MNSFTLGQYYPGKSILHRLDPRAKVFLTICFIVCVFLCQEWQSYVALLLFSFILVLFSSIPFKIIWKSLKPIMFVLCFTLIINVFFFQGESLIWEWHFLHVYTEGIYHAIFMGIRIVTLVLGSCLFLTYTTTPIALTDAIEQLLRPLKWLHLPVHEFAMMLTIALRFIPTLVEETQKIMAAQKARGADFSSGGLIKRAKALIPILVPLIVSSFRRADELATAMECRCYRGDNGRTKMKVLHYSLEDAIFMASICIFGFGIVVLNHFSWSLPL